MKISTTAFKKPVATLAIAAAICIIGLYFVGGIPVNLLPDVTYPLVKVYVNWRGATPAEIEDNIADVIEPKMATVDNLDYLESQATEGQYQLYVNFSYQTDDDVAYQDVLAKMGMIRNMLPKDADEPRIQKADPSQLPVLDLMVTSGSMDAVSLRTWVDNQLQPEFSGIEGTAGTEVSGGMKREIRVLLDVFRLQATGISIDKLMQRLSEQNLEMAAGRVTSDKKEFVVRTLSRYQSLQDIRDLVIEPDKFGGTIYLKDVADIQDSNQTQRIITKLNGKEGIKLSVFKQAASNTVLVEKSVQAKLKEIRTRLPEGVQIEVAYNQANYIRSANKGVRDAAMLAGILIILVTMLFLSGWRRVLMIVLTLPVSLLGTLAAMKVLGFSFNILSLGGLVVSFTVILDNSLVVLENITRLQKEKCQCHEPVRHGVSQVAKPITFSTLTFIAIFLPFLMVPGLTTLLFKELIITIAFVVVFSLLTSLTVIPALARLFFGEGHHDEKQAKRDKAGKSESVMNHFLAAYSRFMTLILDRAKLISVVILIVMLLVSLLLFKQLGSEFLPQADDGMISVKVKLPTGSSTATTANLIEKIETEVGKLPLMESYTSVIGGRIAGLVTTEVANEGEVNLQLVPQSQRKITTDQFINKYRKQITQAAKYPGAVVKVFHTKMKGLRAVGDFDIELEIYSPKNVDLASMYSAAQQLMKEMKDNPNLGNLDLSMDLTKPEYHFIIDRYRSADLGITPQLAAQTLRTLIDGQIATLYQEEGYFYPVRIIVNEKDIVGIEDIRNLPITGKNGTMLLRDIGTVERAVGPVSIDRKNQLRLIKITGTVTSEDVGTVTKSVYSKISQIKLPEGAYIKAGGQADAIAKNNRVMMAVILLGIFFAFILLTIQFESLKLPLIIMIAIPFSLTGFVLALYLAKIPMGVTAIIGIIVLLGMLINHWVLVLSFMEERMNNSDNIKKSIVEAATLRLRPILMTFFTDVLGLMPFMLGLTEGTEMLKPLGVAVIGGITWSLVITFVLVPIIYYTFNKKRVLMPKQ